MKKILVSLDVVPIEKTEYGQLYEIKGELTGPNGISLSICTIWMIEAETSISKFITMYPDK